MRAWAATRGYSLAFMSRVEIKRHEWLRPRGGRHPFLEVEPAGAGFSVFGLHLSAVHSNWTDRKSTRLNSSHTVISYAVFCLKKKKKHKNKVIHLQGKQIDYHT